MNEWILIPRKQIKQDDLYGSHHIPQVAFHRLLSIETFDLRCLSKIAPMWWGKRMRARRQVSKMTLSARRYRLLVEKMKKQKLPEKPPSQKACWNEETTWAIDGPMPCSHAITSFSSLAVCGARLAFWMTSVWASGNWRNISCARPPRATGDEPSPLHEGSGQKMLIRLEITRL